MKQLALILFTSCLVIPSLFAQDKNAIIQQRIEFISEQLESEEIDLTNVLEALTFRIDNPINLNFATKESLEELGLLTDIQISDLLLHIKKHGKLISIYELQSLTYWDLETIFQVLPFVRVDDKFDNIHVGFKEAIKQGNFDIFLRYQRILEDKKGYSDVPDSVLQQSNSYYYGNPDRYYARFRYAYRTNLSIGITGEKDAGEQFFKGAQENGFDFYSMHAFYKGGKYLRAVALGDYQIQIGQGLNLWSSYAFGKTADVTNIKKSANILKPYTSVDEQRFMRGAAVDLGFRDFQLALFGSVKKVDGSAITDTLLEDLEFITSINISGLHRTNSEIARKNSLTEIIYGGNLRYEKRNLHIGLATVSQGYNKEFNKPIQPYNQFDFRGKNTVSMSGDYSYVLRNFMFFGEVSYVSHSKSFANLHGILFSIDSRASISLLYRNFQRGYETFYNAAFAEGSQTKNEKGIYAGLAMNLSKAWTINTYFDLFEFPWMKYQVDAPSRGHEFLFQPTYKPTREFEIYARFRQQLRQKNSRDSDGSVTPIEDVMQRNYRLNLSYKVSESFTVKSRIEYVTINRPSNKPEDGIMFIQDLVFKPKSFPLDITLRYSIFDTDSYDSRMYTFESNAINVFSVPAYYYQGSRAYFLIRYSFLKHVDLWFRYGVFMYSNRKTLGSGAEEINQPQKTDLTIQLRMQF